MKHEYHTVVIGAGSAGLVVSAGLSIFGAKVALIEKDKMGGDCLNVGCVPSKSLLKSGHIAKDIEASAKFGLSASLQSVDLSKVMDRVHSVIKTIEPHDSQERFEGLGVKVLKGEAKVKSKHEVEVSGSVLTAKNIVIAVGSGPLVPGIPGLHGGPYLTNMNLFELKKLPKRLVIMGGGPIGLEIGQALKHLSAEVIVIDMLPGIFVKDDPEVGPIMEKVLRADGIEFQLNSKIKKVKWEGEKPSVVVEKDGTVSEVSGDKLLVALGRVPQSKGLGLEEVGVKVNEKGYVLVDETLRSSVKNIYACGDVVGPYQFTHMAGYQAGIVVRNLIFPFKKKVNYSSIPWATYTKPEVAHVGYTEPWAKEEGLFKDSVMVDIKEMDRAQAEDDLEGFLKLIIGPKGRLIGATMVGDKAGEIISLAVLAIQNNMKGTVFANLTFPYPTEGEIFKFASYALLKKSFKPWMKGLINRVFLGS